MSIQSNRVLKDLIKCQHFEGNVIFADYDSETLSGCRESDEDDITVDFRYPSSVMSSIFDHLFHEGFIEDCSDGQWMYLKVTHSGNHHIQSRILKILNFLSTSVIVPIIVTILTSVACHLLTRWLPWLK